MSPDAIIAIITAALALLPLVIRLVEMTVEIISNIIKKHKNKAIAVAAKEMIADIAKDPNLKHININDIGKDAVFVAEVDKKNEVVGKIMLADKAEAGIVSELEKHSGAVIIEG